MKFIRIISNNTDNIYPIGPSDIITLENKNGKYSGAKLYLNKKDFLIELNDGVDDQGRDIYEQICKWLSNGTLLGEKTDLFTINKGSIDNYMRSKYEVGGI